MVYYLRQQGRMRGLTLDMVNALVQSFENVRALLGEAKIADLLRSGSAELVVRAILTSEVLDRALIPVSEQVYDTIRRAFQQTVPDLPKGGTVDHVLAVSFNRLNPDVLAAIQQLDSAVIEGLKTDIREAVRMVIAEGLKNGDSPSTIAMGLRDYIGLGPTQAQEVLNFRDALMGVDGRSVADYSLRNRVVDGLLKRNGSLTPAQVEKYTDAYRKARIANNTTTVATTAMKDSYKLGQRASWLDAADKGVVPADYTVLKTWVGVMDDREREEHVAMEGETVPMDEPYSNGNMDPGDDTYNCRCISRFSVVPTADVEAFA